MALGKLLAEQHGDVVYPAHDDLPQVPRGALDDDWLPIIGQRRLVVITLTWTFVERTTGFEPATLTLAR